MVDFHSLIANYSALRSWTFGQCKHFLMHLIICVLDHSKIIENGPSLLVVCMHVQFARTSSYTVERKASTV